MPESGDTQSKTNPNTLGTATHTITLAHRWDHILARWGVNRNGHRVEPGLYRLGQPGPEAPVLVSANYTLSFDALRSALPGIDAYILVIDTQGVNVWCAAGKGTFGTAELVHRVQVTELEKIISHRVLIVPQLGAPGVAAHEVRKQCGFKVEYGPVRAADLPAYLQTHTATPEMRRVRYDLADRLVLIPIEVVGGFVPALVIAIAGYFIGGWQVAAALVTAALAGTVLFPILLPWLTTPVFSVKGFVLGALVSLPWAFGMLGGRPGQPGWLPALGALGVVLLAMPVTAFLALNFTGSTTYTSKTGVRREMYTYIPVMAGMAGIGLVLTAAHTIVNTWGGF